MRWKMPLLIGLLGFGWTLGSACVSTAPGLLSLNPPNRPLNQGDFELGTSAGATVLAGNVVANLWFRYGLIAPLTLDITGFYMHPVVGGGNIALRWNAHRGDLFSLHVVPGLGLGTQAKYTSKTNTETGTQSTSAVYFFHLSPNLGLVGSWALGHHALYIGLRSSFALAPQGVLLNTVYNTVAIGSVFTIAKRFHIHLELMGGLKTDLTFGTTSFFGTPTLGFSVTL